MYSCTKTRWNYRLCTDYRKVNTVTKTGTYPIPRIHDCIDKIGNARYVSKFDLLKGFWQVPLTERAKEISAFVTPDGNREEWRALVADVWNRYGT